jgi:hypothetical protein
MCESDTPVGWNLAKTSHLQEIHIKASRDTFGLYR